MAQTTRTLNPLPFEALEPHRFEDLVRQITYDFRNWRSLEPTGRLGSDDGYDARGFELVPEQEEPDEEDAENGDSENLYEDRLWQIQCKREKTITPAKIEKYADEMLKDGNPVPYGVIFAAPCDFSKKTRDAFIKKVREKHVQEFCLWGKADLEDMLMQPKNDHLLYAYFGISLVIRRRTIKSQLRSILATKRKTVRALGEIDQSSFKEVLLRDVHDTHYPYKGEVKDYEKNPPWKPYHFVGHYHEGIEVIVAKFYAYRELDHNTGKLKSWDYSQEVNLAKTHENPWEKEEEGNPNWRAYKYWSEKIDKQHQAYFEFVRRVPYSRIIEVDPLGDTIAKCPHIFIEKKNGSFFEEGGYAYLTGSDRWAHTSYLQTEDDKLRGKVLPDKFPEVTDDALPPMVEQKKDAKSDTKDQKN